MGYLALYRTYRPRDFSQIIGQDHIISTLQNQIRTGRIGHAYLFCGTRGTGKTTTAKVFARAINCVGKNPPCGKCAVCRELQQASSMDILEMDAASNNKVDEIRELRERVQYPPVVGKYKVFIIDEVHMLTDSAFNALLKTLEEPPEYVVFILATTEPQKLPATILSRVMRFDFRLVSQDLLEQLLEKIFRDIQVEYEAEAVRAIAEAGEGSVRDMLSVADRCISGLTGKLEYEYVTEILGVSDRALLFNLTEGMLRRDLPKVLTQLDTVYRSGKSMVYLAKDLTQYFSDLLCVRLQCEQVVNLPEKWLGAMREQAAHASREFCIRAFQRLAALEGEMRQSIHPRMVLESALVQLTTPENDFDPQAIALRLQNAETQLRALQMGTQETGTPSSVQSAELLTKTQEQVPQPERTQESVSQPANTLEKASKSATAKAQESAQSGRTQKEHTPQTTLSCANTEWTGGMLWGKVLRALRETDHIVLYAACQNVDGNAIQVSDGQMYLTAKSLAEYELFCSNQAVFDEILQKNLKIALKCTPRMQEKSKSRVDLKQLSEYIGEDKLTIESEG